jgi:hypothetical protein
VLAGIVSLGIGGLIALEFSQGDPLDKFEVLASIKDQASDQHAVTFKHYHADSSNTVTATWITQFPRNIGSTERVRGRPAISWHGLKNFTPTWAQGRLTLIVPLGTELRSIKSSDCYFEYDKSPIVCFDEKLATVERK